MRKWRVSSLDTVKAKSLNATVRCCSVPEQRLLIFHPWWTNHKMHLNTWTQWRPQGRVCVCFTQWVCCFASKLNEVKSSLKKMWFNRCQNIYFTVLGFFFWAERDCQQPQKFCAMCLGDICQTRPQTSLNARGCFELASARGSAGSKNLIFSVPAFQRKRSTFCRTGKHQNLQCAAFQYGTAGKGLCALKKQKQNKKTHKLKKL